MPLAQDIYESLLKDPDLDIGSHQTREEAAETEANFRARQYVNNVKALSLASEPLKEESSIKALINHVSSMAKSMMTGTISVVQNIQKKSMQEAKQGFSGDQANKKWNKNPVVVKKRNELHPKAQEVLGGLIDAGVPIGNVIKLLDNIYTSLPKKGDELDSDDWIPSLVDDLFKPNSARAKKYGIDEGHLHKLHPVISDILPGVVVDSPLFKPGSYHHVKADFYGGNTKKQLLVPASVANVNKALEKMGFPHRIGIGGSNRIKFVDKNGNDVKADTYHNPFGTERKGNRIYESHIDGKDPDSTTHNLTDTKLYK